MGTYDDRRSQHVQGEFGMQLLFLLQEIFEFGLLGGVEELRVHPGRPVLGDPDRVVGMEPIGRGGRGVDEPRRAGVRCGFERVERAVDVDAAGRGRGARSRNEEG